MKFDLIIKDATIEDLERITAAVKLDELVAENPNIHMPTTKAEAYQVGKQIQASVQMPSAFVITRPDGSTQTVENEQYVKQLNQFGGGAVASEEETSNVDVSGQLDSDGLPWDARIHSSNKKYKADGTWTRRRGITDIEFDTIKAELRGASIPANGGVLSSSVPTPIAAPVFPIPLAAPTPVMPPMPVAPTMPVMPDFLQRNEPAQVQYNLNDLFAKMQTGLSSGKLRPDYAISLVQQINAAHGVQATSLVDFANRPDLINAAMNLLTQAGA
jgi:NACalpha-BTF3-like transcription factor